MKNNKYEQKIEAEIDLHGLTREEAKTAVLNFLKKSQEKNLKIVQIITGQGLHSENQAVLKPFIENLLKKEGLSFESAKYNQGGRGAIKVKLL